MPPRKRAAVKLPEPDSPAEVMADAGQPVAAGLADGVKAAEEEPAKPPGGKDSEAEEPAKAPAPDPDDDSSDELDACFPNGWPDGATAVGCEHGSWTR